MEWTELLAIVIPIICAILTSPLVLRRLQEIDVVRRNQLEDDVSRWVKIACSYAERWAENTKREAPATAIASREKLAVAMDLVRASVGPRVSDRAIEARIEHELVERDAPLVDRPTQEPIRRPSR